MMMINDFVSTLYHRRDITRRDLAGIARKRFVRSKFRQKMNECDRDVPWPCVNMLDVQIYILDIRRCCTWRIRERIRIWISSRSPRTSCCSSHVSTHSTTSQLHSYPSFTLSKIQIFEILSKSVTWPWNWKGDGWMDWEKRFEIVRSEVLSESYRILGKLYRVFWLSQTYHKNVSFFSPLEKRNENEKKDFEGEWYGMEKSI